MAEYILDEPPRVSTVITLKITRGFWFRIWLGTWMLNLAGWVLNWDLEIVHDTTDDEGHLVG